MKRYYFSILFFVLNLSLINCQIVYDLKIPNTLYVNYQNLYFNNNTFCSIPKIDSVFNAINSYKLEILKEMPLIYRSNNTIIRFINSTDINKIGRISIIDSIANIISYQISDNFSESNGRILTIKKDSFSVKLSSIKANLDDFENQLNFWNSENYIDTDADDCESWVIEWSEKGRYHAISRYCPNDKFLEPCKILLKLSKLDDSNKQPKEHILKTDRKF